MCEGTRSWQHGDFSFCLFVEWGRVKSTDSENIFELGELDPIGRDDGHGETQGMSDA
jgi:hypothetical protein